MFVVIVLGLSLCLATVGCRDGGKPRVRNVVLISLDTLRADHMSSYGYNRKTSPHLDALAARGTMFENAISSSSWTTPAHASFFTGLLSSEHGAAQLNQPIKPDVPMLTEYLKEAGFQTAAFITHIFVGEHLGFGRGFDTFWFRQNARADVPTDAAIQWLGIRDKKQPFFVFIHLFDPHLPYAPVESYLDDYDEFCRRERGDFSTLNKLFTPDAELRAKALACLIRRYDDEIHYADAQIGRLVDVLEREKLLEETLIVFLSDHGEEFLDHGSVLHAITLYQEQLHVPLILAGGPADVIPRGKRVSGRVRTFDIVPTILDLLGIKAKHDMTAAGLTPYLRGETNADRNSIAETNDVGPDRMTLLQGSHKYIYAPDAHVFQQYLGEEFFDLATDPAEKHNLMTRQPATASRVRQEMTRQGKYTWRKAWRVMWGGGGTKTGVQGTLTTPDRFTTVSKYLGFSRFDDIPDDLPVDQTLRRADFKLQRSNRQITFHARNHAARNGFLAVPDDPYAPLLLTVEWETPAGEKRREELALDGEVSPEKPLRAAGGLVTIYTEPILTFPNPPTEFEIGQQEKLPGPLRKKLRALGYF